MELHEISTIRRLADLVFDPVPKGVSILYEKKVYGREYSLKTQFINYCIKNSLVPKYEDRVEIQTEAFRVWDRYIYDDSETFVILDENGREEFDFSKFSVLFH